MSYPKKATRLEELALQLIVEPLRSGDPRYVDLSAGRGNKVLRRMELHLRDFSAEQNHFAHVAFTGHRGAGKSTELLRLEHALADRFFALHLFTDETILRDCEYTELLLWLVDALVRQFAEQKLPLDAKLVERVTDWFAEKTLHKVDQVKKEIELTAEVEGEARAGFYWLSLKLLARLKSLVIGSAERRTEARRELQRYASELIAQVNLLLDNAADVLQSKGRSPDILIVQDNLDRLPPEAAHKLFFTNGDLLKELRVHVVYTAPVALLLAPWNIGKVFASHFNMPVVKVRGRNGRPHAEGIEALHALLAARMEVGEIFADSKVARELVLASGGSVRDLMRLLNQAQLAARVDEKARIDATSAGEAMKLLRIEFEQLLIPGQAYYPLLARVHRGKHEGFSEAADSDQVRFARELLAELLFNGSVFEYNGETNWFDVHPLVQQSARFKDALKQDRQSDGPRA
ncbi:MAG: hypothetical protein HC897_18085 [Thermoanaerobaculia bacterium]|nr:hypothetical protein [Thermoanaerobaculia bacterium]